MKPIECTSDFIYFLEEDELHSNSVSYEIIAKSPVEALDIAGQNVNGWYKVELAHGEDLSKVDRKHEYDLDTWYIVGGRGNMMGIRLKNPGSVKTYEALISF